MSIDAPQTGVCLCLRGRASVCTEEEQLRVVLSVCTWPPLKYLKKKTYFHCVLLLIRPSFFSPLERRVPPFGRRLKRPLKKENRLNGFCTHIQCLLLVFLSLSLYNRFFLLLSLVQSQMGGLNILLVVDIFMRPPIQNYFSPLEGVD